MADAHKSLLNTPITQTEKEVQQVQRATVAPTRRALDTPNIVIQIPADNCQEGDSISICGNRDNEDEISEKLVTKPDKVKNVASNLKKIIDLKYPILKRGKEDETSGKRKSMETDAAIPTAKKRKTIVFDVVKKVEETENMKTVEAKAASSSSVTLATVSTAKTHKYDSIPPLSTTDRKLVWCRMFPACRYGSACAFTHPRCKFMARCSRPNCVYSHLPTATITPSHSRPSVVSHVVKAVNFKPTSTAVKNKCKYYPNCKNPKCNFYHPKACRYGVNCPNILCPFYHAEVSLKWYPA